MADTIVEGEVTDVRSEWKATSQGNVIVTKITVKIQATLKGSPSSSLELEQLGGRVGDVRMEVSDAPRWASGSHEVLFVSQNGKAIFPTIAANFGRFVVARDPSGEDLIQRPDGSVVFESDVDSNSGASSGVGAAKPQVTLVQLKASIRDHVAGKREGTVK